MWGCHVVREPKLTPVRDQVERFWDTWRQSDAQSSLRGSPATLWLQTRGNTCQTSPSQPGGTRKHWLEHSSGQNWRSDSSRCDIDTKHVVLQTFSKKKKNTICLCYFSQSHAGDANMACRLIVLQKTHSNSTISTLTVWWKAYCYNAR